MTRPPALVLSACCPPVSACHRLRAVVIDSLSTYMCVRPDSPILPAVFLLQAHHAGDP